MARIGLWHTNFAQDVALSLSTPALWTHVSSSLMYWSNWLTNRSQSPVLPILEQPIRQHNWDSRWIPITVLNNVGNMTWRSVTESSRSLSAWLSVTLISKFDKSFEPSLVKTIRVDLTISISTYQKAQKQTQSILPVCLAPLPAMTYIASTLSNCRQLV